MTIRLLRKALFLFVFFYSFNISIASAFNELGVYDKTVLIIQSYSRDYMHSRELESGIENFFETSSYNVSFKYEFLDTKNYFDTNLMRLFKDQWLLKYQNVQLDGIILCDDDALNFYKAYGAEIFGKEVPVVAIGINSVKAYEPKLEGIVLLEERPNYEKNIDLALMQNQSADTIHFFYDVTTTSKQVYEELVPLLNKKYPTLKHFHHQDKCPSEMKNILSAARPNEIFFLVIYSRAPDQTAYIYDEVSKFLSEDAPAPLYVFWEFYMNSGAFGGFVASSIKYGESGASTLIDLWKGEKIEPILYEKGLNHRYIFDYLIASKYKITTFPDETLFINKPDSFWDKYQKVVIGFSVFCAILMLVIFLQYRNVKLHQRENELLKKNKEIQKNINENLEAEVNIRTQEYQLLNTKLEMSLLLTEDKNKEISSINEQLSQAIDSLKKTQLKLIESEKMASLGGLVAGISHEINTPLGVTLTGSSFLLEHFKTLYPKYQANILKKSELDVFFDEMNHTLPTTLESLMQAITLINKFKQIAISQEVHSKIHFNIKDYISETLKTLYPLLEKHHITLEFDCPNDIWYDGDPNWFFQLINQLIDNSIKHGFKNQNSHKLIIFEISKFDEDIKMTYMDNGSGMSSALVNQIFDPFFTTERNNGTGGIGLYIVYNIVISGLNGSIVCHSEEAGGITFTINFPLSNHS